MRASEQSRPIRCCARECAFDVAEQRRDGAVAMQRRAIEFHEASVDLVARLLQVVDTARQEGLAGAGRPHQQHGERERIATRSISSIMVWKCALRVAIPDFRNATPSACSREKRWAIWS